MKMEELSLIPVLTHCSKYRMPELRAFLKGESCEQYKPLTSTEGSLFGLSIGIILLLILVSLALWIWAVVWLVMYYKSMPQWAVIVCVLCLLLLPGPGPIVTLIIVGVTRHTKHSSSSSSPSKFGFSKSHETGYW